METIGRMPDKKPTDRGDRLAVLIRLRSAPSWPRGSWPAGGVAGRQGRSSAGTVERQGSVVSHVRPRGRPRAARTSTLRLPSSQVSDDELRRRAARRARGRTGASPRANLQYVLERWGSRGSSRPSTRTSRRAGLEPKARPAHLLPGRHGPLRRRGCRCPTPRVRHAPPVGCSNPGSARRRRCPRPIPAPITPFRRANLDLQ